MVYSVLTKIESNPFAPRSTRFWRGLRIQWATCLPGPYIAVAIDQHGVALLDSKGKLCSVLFQNSGLPDPNILNLGSDRSGGLWVCGNAGLTRVEITPGISFFDSQNGLPLSAVFNLKRFRGRMYAATWDGLFGLERADANTLPPNFTRLPVRRRPTPTLADVGTELMAGGWKGFYSFDGIELKQLPIPIERVYSLKRSESGAGRVYVASNQGLAAISKNGDGWRVEDMLSDFGGPVTDVIESGADQLFVSTLNRGFFRVKLQPGSPRFSTRSTSSAWPAQRMPQRSVSPTP